MIIDRQDPEGSIDKNPYIFATKFSVCRTNFGHHRSTDLQVLI